MLSTGSVPPVVDQVHVGVLYVSGNMGELVAVSAVVGDEFAAILPVMLACVASMVAMVWWMSRGRDNRHVHPQRVRENHQTSVSC